MSAVLDVIDHPSGFLACAPTNRRFALDGVAGFVAWREHRRYWIALGGIHARDCDRPRLLAAFVDAARSAGRRPLFVQVPEDQLPLFTAAGATVNRLGASFGIRLSGYTLRGTPKIALRNKIHRAKRSGLVVAEVGRDIDDGPRVRDAMRSISEQWLRGKGKKELAFMTGVASDERDAERRIFVALDAAGDVVAFITYVPAWGRHPGLLHDLSRRRPSAPPGVMELVNATAIERFRDEGVGYLHFGFTPFVLVGEEPPQANGALARLAGWLYRHGRIVYPAKSQADYKRKWGTDLMQPEYIAGFPLTLGGVWALLGLTRAI